MNDGITVAQAATYLRRFLDDDLQMRLTACRIPGWEGRKSRLVSEQEVASTCLEVVLKCTGIER